MVTKLPLYGLTRAHLRFGYNQVAMGELSLKSMMERLVETRNCDRIQVKTITFAEKFMSKEFGHSAQATVIGDSDAPPETCAAAEQIGKMLARLGITVITGGRGGVMEAVSRGAKQTGGITVGILPSAEMSEANQWCSVVIPTGFGHARNILTVLAGDFLIALGSSAGTLSEICFAWIHGKPILTLKGYGTWSDKVANTNLDQRYSSTIIECPSLEILEKAVIEICQRMDKTPPGLARL